MTPPDNPAGAYVPEEGYGAARREELIRDVEAAPARLRAAVAGLTDAQLDTRYKNWTARQIVHHLAHSHANAYVRFKLALTEEVPTIKPYDEGRWVSLPDARGGDVAAPLALLDGLHACWAQMLRAMSEAEFTRTYFHPEYGKAVSLSAALSNYAWHGRHHTGQIEWLRNAHGWGR